MYKKTELVQWWIGIFFLCFVGVLGCSLESAVDVDTPELEREKDPDYVTSRDGGLGLYYSAISNLSQAVSEKSMRVGVLTDELANTITAGLWLEGDSRTESELNFLVKGLNAEGEYIQLHAARIAANQARTLLRTFNDPVFSALIAGTYTIEAYSIMSLAEDFCSGIPLTAVPFKGDIVYGEALSTTQLFNTAIILFDSALAITHDSASITTLARIGKGRALLGLGKYAEAAQAVATVQPNDAFLLTFSQASAPGWSVGGSFWTRTVTSGTAPSAQVEVVNREGGNGMTWYTDASNLDPRFPVTTTMVNNAPAFPVIVRQQKFVTGTLTFPLARWIEAQMIQAEAALQRDDPTWVTWINDARATVNLPALDDPGTRAARVELLFHERAFWFYLEGQRLADFRRLVRQYNQDPYTVYPSGMYTKSDGTVPFYGDAWVFSPPIREMNNNYRYSGCFSKQP